MTRRRVHLDANIIAGLALEKSGVARDCVGQERARGSLILLSPSVIAELRRVRKNKRQKYIEAALEYCDGYTGIGYQELIKLEIMCFNEGRSVPEIPIVPIAEIAWLAGEDDGEDDAKRANESAAALKGLVIENLKGIKKNIDDEDVRDGFGAFYPLFARVFYNVLMTVFTNDGVPAPQIGPNGPPARIDRRAFASALDMLAANSYRIATEPHCKGAVAMSDMWNIVEISYSDVLLTRDDELYQCGLLRETAWPGSKPIIERAIG